MPSILARVSSRDSPFSPLSVSWRKNKINQSAKLQRQVSFLILSIANTYTGFDFFFLVQRAILVYNSTEFSLFPQIVLFFYCFIFFCLNLKKKKESLNSANQTMAYCRTKLLIMQIISKIVVHRSRTDIFGVSFGCFAATDFPPMVVPLFPDVYYAGSGFTGALTMSRCTDTVEVMNTQFIRVRP